MVIDRIDVSTMAGLLDQHAVEAFYVGLPDPLRGSLIAALARDGTWFADDWPCVPHPTLGLERTVSRVVRVASEERPNQSECGVLSASPPIDEEMCTLIADLQTGIEKIADAVLAAGPGRELGARRIMTVGSTSRGTFTALPVDFDLVILTDRPQDEFDHRVAKSLCRSIADAMARDASFRAYWQAISARAAAKTGLLPGAALEWFGVRGKQSLVGRIEAQWSDAGTRTALPFIDVTFGKLPQLVGYEIWIRRYFERLGPRNAHRLRGEIRRAKSVMKRWGRISGSVNRGLRAHAIEQLVIQAHSYRSAGFPFGTFRNAMLLIAEEAIDWDDGEASSFDRYRRAFPLWHPGWWESEVGFGPFMHNVDLWDFLGDGDPQAAGERWRELIELARLVAYGQNAPTELERESGDATRAGGSR